MKIDLNVYADGSHLIADGHRQRLEVIELNAPRHLVLANVAAAPMQLGEISMVFEVPLFVMKEQLLSPCDLKPNQRYPVKTGSGDHVISGEFGLEGDSIRFVLQEHRGRDQVSYAGRLAYKDSRGTIPAALDIAKWTVFRDSLDPKDGHSSRFDTLGDLRKSLSREQ